MGVAGAETQEKEGELPEARAAKQEGSELAEKAPEKRTKKDGVLKKVKKVVLGGEPVDHWW